MNELYAEESRQLLKSVGSLLNKIGTEFFVDSGTLLGIVRSGDLLSHDSDIDIGITSFDADKLQDLAALCLSSGIILREKYYLGRVQGLNFRWTEPRRSLAVHAHCYFRHGDYYCSPQTVKYRKPEFWPHGRWQAQNAARAAKTLMLLDDFRLKDFSVRKLARPPELGLARLLDNKFGHRLYREYYLAHLRRRLRALPGYSSGDYYDLVHWKRARKYVASYTWIIPAHLFDSTREAEFCGVPIRLPAQDREYLVLRYGGDWETPNLDWMFFVEDGGLYSVPYEFVVPHLERMGNPTSRGANA